MNALPDNKGRMVMISHIPFNLLFLCNLLGFGVPVTVNPMAVRRGPLIKLVHMRLRTAIRAFFVFAALLYGGRAWDSLGCTGCQLARSASLRTVVTLNRVAAICGSFVTQVGAPPIQVQNSSAANTAALEARTLAALRSNRFSASLGLQAIANLLGADACEHGLSNEDANGFQNAISAIACRLGLVGGESSAAAERVNPKAESLAKE